MQILETEDLSTVLMQTTALSLSDLIIRLSGSYGKLVKILNRMKENGEIIVKGGDFQRFAEEVENLAVETETDEGARELLHVYVRENPWVDETTLSLTQKGFAKTQRKL